MLSAPIVTHLIRFGYARFDHEVPFLNRSPEFIHRQPCGVLNRFEIYGTVFDRLEPVHLPGCAIEQRGPRADHLPAYSQDALGSHSDSSTSSGSDI